MGSDGIFGHDVILKKLVSVGSFSHFDNDIFVGYRAKVGNNVTVQSGSIIPANTVIVDGATFP